MAIRFPEIPREQFDAKADRMPTVIPTGTTFRVPAGTQQLFSHPVQIEGDAVIQIDGVLIEVD